MITPATTRRVVYIGYDLEDMQAPHQAMGAIFLAMHGHQVTYLTTGHGPAPAWTVTLATLEYVIFPRTRRRNGLSLMRHLWGLLRAGSVDCLYIQGAQQALLCAWVPRLFPEIEILYHTQDFKPLITPLYSRAERMLARRSTQVICNEINRAKVMELGHGLRVTPAVIRTALPSAWPVPDRDPAQREEILAQLPAELRTDAILLVAGGPYMARRRSKQLVQALAHLDRRYCLVFTGMELDTPRHAACLAAANAESVRDRIVLLPRIGYYELLALYAACEIGVLLYCDTDLANFYQGPGRITEYLRAGLPFVTSDYPGLELLALKYGVGVAARSTDPADIARAIRTLAPRDDADRQARAERLRLLARTTLAYEHDAQVVFGERFALRPEAEQSAHPLWHAFAGRESLESEDG